MDATAPELAHAPVVSTFAHSNDRTSAPASVFVSDNIGHAPASAASVTDAIVPPSSSTQQQQPLAHENAATQPAASTTGAQQETAVTIINATASTDAVPPPAPTSDAGRRKRRAIKYVDDDGSDDEEVERVALEKKRKARTLDYQLRPTTDANYPELDQIVGRRIDARTGSVEYLCKFVGRSFLHLWWLHFDELELFLPGGYHKQHRVQQFDRKLRREGYTDIDDVDDLEANKVTIEKILSHRVDPRDRLDDQIDARRQELAYPRRYPHVSDYFLVSNADVLPERMGGIVKKLLNESGGNIFEHPVDTDEIPEYTNVIANPMDLGTIATRIARETFYVGPAALSLFVSDVRLVFRNCKEFNAAQSDIWMIADELSKTFEKWLYDWILAPSAWLRLTPTVDKAADKRLGDAFRDDAESQYDQWTPWEPGCRVCHTTDNTEQLLLCDRCDGEIHMYCATPELTELPTDEWFCAFCVIRNAFEARRVNEPEPALQGEEEEEEKEGADDKPAVAVPATTTTGDKAPDGNDKAAIETTSLPASIAATTAAVPSIVCAPLTTDRCNAPHDKKYNRKVVASTSTRPSSTTAAASAATSSVNPTNDRATFFLVKWVGLSIKYSTWERPEDIGDDEQIQRYFRFSRVPTENEILQTTCQLPCCAKRNPYLLQLAAQTCCEKDRFCLRGSRHAGDCSRELKTLNDETYGSAAHIKLRMVEQVKAQLYAFHCLLNNHAPDRDVLKQCGVFANAFVSKRQHLLGGAIGKTTKKKNDEDEDEDYSDRDDASDDDDDDDDATFRPMYPGVIDDVGASDDGALIKKKPEDDVADVLSSIVEHVALGYATTLTRTPKRVRCNATFRPTSFPGVHTFSEYCVALRRTKLGLGMRMGMTGNNCVAVLGFQPLAGTGGIGPAEASRVIVPGDVLVGVNNHAVAGLTFKDVVQVIARSPDLILFHFHSRRVAVAYPTYSQAKQVVVQIDPVREFTVTPSEFAPFSYATFVPLLKVGTGTGSARAAAARRASRATALASSSAQFIAPTGPMQHLYAGVIDNSIDPHEHFASFLPAKAQHQQQRRLNSSNKSDKNEFVPYEQSPTYKGSRTLRPYQVEGLNWMIASYKAQRSTILADEMGLGKTVQVVSFIEHLRTEESIRGPYLIVVPLSTIQHWRREIESWTDLNVCVYHDVGGMNGTAKDMRAILREQEWYYTGMSNTIFKFNILLTTFETLLADFEELETIHWRLVVVDEAHRLKSQGSRVLKQMRAFRCDRKLLLTGTPLQNNIQELWVLLNYLEPIKFDNMDTFNAKFGKLISQEQVEELQKLLGPFILRRVKEDVEKSIPPKEETIIAVELTTLQKQYYRAIYDKNKSFLYRGTKNGLPQLNNIQLQLRMCCNHPFLIKGVEDRELEELGPSPSPTDVMHKVVQCSGKMVLVSKLLPKLKREGHKVLIFSQFLKQLDMLERYCEFHGFGYERLDGSTGGSMRQSAIDRFSRPGSKSTVFLLSTKAGGVGINLIAADTVIIFDSDWNPMNDLQAQSRCHRIGQKKSVQIYRLVTRNTYESEMFDRASRKLGLEHAILGTASFSETAQVEKPSSELLVELLKRGAYALMEDDDTASKEFADRDIETILKENARVRVMAQGAGNDGDDVDNASEHNSDDASDSGNTTATAHSSRKASPTKKRVRKSLGGMAVDRSSFVAEGSTGELAVDDPNFWEKVLPGAVSVEMLILKLEDGSAVSSRQAKIKFISNLDIALSELVHELSRADSDNDSRFGAANLAHEYDIAIQILHAVTSKYRKEFSPEQLDVIRGYLSKLEKSRVRSCRVVPTKKASKKRSGAAMYGLDSDDEDDDDDASKRRARRQDDDAEADRSLAPRKKQKRSDKTLASPNKQKRGLKKRSSNADAVHAIALFEGGVINDSDDLCTLCGDGGLILLCDGPCHRSFHLECIGMDAEPDADHWLCPDCAAGRHMCLICKQVGEMGVEFGVIQCSMAKCGRFYHRGCLTKHAHVEWVGKKRFRCPSHFCHNCTKGTSDATSKSPTTTPTKATKASDASVVVSCIHCSQAFHPQCMLARDKFIRLSTNLMICASHLRDTKAPPAAASRMKAKVESTAAAFRARATSVDIDNNDGDVVQSTAGTTAAATTKRKRTNPPVGKFCGFCHRGDVMLNDKSDAAATNGRKAKRTSKASKRASDALPPLAAIEGPFVVPPTRIQTPNKPGESVYVHLNCALHSPEVFLKPDGKFMNLQRAIKRGRLLKCSACKAHGATVGCVIEKCKLNYHLRCAVEHGGAFLDSPYTLYCRDHAAAKRAAAVATHCVCETTNARDKALALTCATCSSKFHPKCVNVASKQVATLAKRGWHCTACSTTNKTQAATKPSAKGRARPATKASAKVTPVVDNDDDDGEEEEEEEEEIEEEIEDEDSDDEHAMVPIVDGRAPLSLIDDSNVELPALKRPRRRKPETPSRLVVASTSDTEAAEAEADETSSPTQLAVPFAPSRNRRPANATSAEAATSTPSLPPLPATKQPLRRTSHGDGSETVSPHEVVGSSDTESSD